MTGVAQRKSAQGRHTLRHLLDIFGVSGGLPCRAPGGPSPKRKSFEHPPETGLSKLTSSVRTSSGPEVGAGADIAGSEQVWQNPARPGRPAILGVNTSAEIGARQKNK